MKKHLIAAAVAAAVAVPAAAQVTVYGRFDQSYNTVDTKTATSSKATTTGLDGGIGGSRLGFRAAEDLGGGLKAAVVYEFGVDAGENSGVTATRLGYAEVAGAFGTVRMGRQVSPGKSVADGFNALGNNTNFTPGDVNNSITGIDNRVSNAITYMTPNMSGFSAQIQYADSNTKTTTETSARLFNGPAGATGAQGSASDGAAGNGAFRTTVQGKIEGFGIAYSAGPLAFAVATHDQTVANAGAITKDNRVAAAATYTLGSTKLHLENSTRKSKTAAGATDIDRDVTTIGVTQPFGATTITAQLFDGDRKLGTTDTTAADYDGFKIRATYALSKRTGVYAQMGETNTKPTNGTQKTTVEGYGLGLYHTF
jgi:predicted porin